MKQNIFLVFFALFLLSLPLSAQAALVNCGTRTSPTPCTVCHLVQGGVNVMDWGLTIMSAIGVVVIVAMAIMYIVSAGNEGLMGTAKAGIKAALIGFAVMLSAWLIVHTTLRIFGANSLTGYQQGSNVFEFRCSTSSSAGTAQGAAPQSSVPIVNTAPINGDSRSAYVADAPVDGPVVVPDGSYLASVTIAGNGTVLPGYRSVVSGQTAQFTIVPEGTAIVTSVTGCGGTLSGDIFVTGPLTGACTITATFAGGSPLAPVEEGGGGNVVGDVGDKGGNWYPDGKNSLLVIDQMGGGSNPVSYVPGCGGKATPTCSSCGCALSDNLGGFQFIKGNILSIRVTGKPDGFPNHGFFQLSGPTGANVYSSVSMWVTTNPRNSYSSTSAACKNTDGAMPQISTAEKACKLTLGQRYYVNIMVNDNLHCSKTGQCRFQFTRSTDSY